MTGQTYTVQRLLGEGGFGAAYCVTTGKRDVCLKVTADSTSWHREAYMAELLRNHPRVVEVLETFPILRRGHTLYAVAMELADGTVEDAVADGGWTERKVVQEVRGLLAAIGRLHDSGAVHRDITPFNVFMCGRKRTLKLGDFGIARHGFGAQGVEADAFAPWFVDPDLYAGSRIRWTTGDDLWQVGQLAAVLLKGEVWPIHTRQVRDLPCSDGVKLAIRRAIGEPCQRFPDAAAMSEALLRPSGLSFGRVRSLRGRTVVFTGPLNMKRRDAASLARAAGARVLSAPSAAMDVLVIGKASPSWVAGSAGGVKVLETMALRERGHDITMITGTQFDRLVRSGGPGRTRR